ncbi:MAG: hypothetical protein IT340_18055 [Chloroflexi bacterium]|nr:hypothetical protein [Chloroflexota bacterium]
MTIHNPTLFAALALGSEGSPPKPDGNHLRWAFRTDRGFPPKGFSVYRRDARKGEDQCLDLRHARTRQRYRGVFQIGAFTFDAPSEVIIEDRIPPSGRFELRLPNVQPLKIFLPRPANRVRIDCLQQASFRARAFAGQVMVAEVVVRRQREQFDLMADFIDRVEIDGVESSLIDFCITTPAKDEFDDLRRHGWELIAGPLDVPAAFADGAGRILGDPVPISDAYGSWLGEAITTLLDPANPLPPHERVLYFIDGKSNSVPPGTDPGKDAMFTVYPLKWLLLAALDPDFARFLGLGYIDETASSGRPYDYLILGQWNDDDYGYICYNVVRAPAPALSPPTGLAAEAFAAVPTTGGDTGLAVGLRWTLPLTAGGYLLPHSAVLYDASGVRLANASAPVPAIPAAGAFPAAPINGAERIVVSRRRLSDGTYLRPIHFITHRNLGDGWYGYRVKGYDIFGRESDWTNPVLARVLDTIPPPAPSGSLDGATRIPIQGRYLQPGDPDLTATDTALIAANGGGPLTVVEWNWFAEQAAIAPDTREFRIYQHPAFATRQCEILSVSAPLGDSVDVTLDANPGINVGNGQLSARGQSFLILTQSTSGEMLKVHVQRRHDAGSETPVIIVPSTGPATVAEPTNLPARWDQRRFVQPINAVPVGHYRAVIPGAALAPTEANPVATAWIGVSAADDKMYIPDDPGRTGALAGRTGNESPIGSRARITGRHLAAPGPGPIPAGPVYATRADFYGRSRYRLTWTASAPLRYHVLRAVESGLTSTDQRARQQRSGYYAGNAPFADDPGFAAWLAANFADVSQADMLQAVLSDRAKAAWTAWAKRFYEPAQLSDALLRQLGDRAGNEVAFIQLTTEAQQAGVFDDEFDGRITGRYMYRTQSVAPNGLKGPLSPTAPPVHLRDVLPPRAPVIERLTVADRSITVWWAANTEPDLDHYEVFRAMVNGGPPRIDPRRMERRGANVPPGGLNYADAGILPAKDYVYTVVAVDTAGNRSDPAIARQGRGIALTPPPAPVVAANRTSDPTRVTLTWTTLEANARSLVHRRLAAGGNWQLVSGWLDPGVFAFTDATAPDFALEYRVTLLDAAGNRSAASNAAVVPTAP